MKGHLHIGWENGEQKKYQTPPGPDAGSRKKNAYAAGNFRRAANDVESLRIRQIGRHH